ncbi:hypothetical protein [Streptomyces sp. NPDC007856]|uniref:hypothetical protein n=1 Tax=Streptomyces sp. NPDC007856 TaxID=3364781 RepID=UPI0036A13604
MRPRTIQSGAKNSTGPAGKGNPWLKGALGEAATSAARTGTFLGARYRRIVKRRGHPNAVVAVARSILVITWHLLNDPDVPCHGLGADWHHRHLNSARKTRDLVRQLQALGHQVTLAPAAPQPHARPRHPVRKRPGCCRLPSRREIFRSANVFHGAVAVASLPLWLRA